MVLSSIGLAASVYSFVKIMRDDHDVNMEVTWVDKSFSGLQLGISSVSLSLIHI